MPGADSSQFTRFKKLTAIQCGDTQSKDPKSVNRLTQYTSPVSTCSLSKFLPSLRKNVSGGKQLPPGTFTFRTNANSVGFYMNCTIIQTATLTNARYHTSNTMTVGPVPFGVKKIPNYKIETIDTSKPVTISGLTALTYLDCRQNQLTSLDVSRLTALKYLDCSRNNFADQPTINNIVGQLPLQNAFNQNYYCIILIQKSKTFTTPDEVPTGWAIS